MKLSEITGNLAKLPTVSRKRVLYGEVDKMNFVYASHYLTWFEQGRNEYLRLCGTPYTQMEADGLALPVVEAHVWYLAPVHYDDLLDIRCAITQWTKTTATFLFSIEVDGERVAAGYTRHACLNAAGRPTPLPDSLVQKALGRFDVGIM